MKLHSIKQTILVKVKGLMKTKIIANLLALSVLVTFSCKNNDEVSDKTKFDEFKTPKSFPLKFSQEKPLKWNVINLDTLPAPKTSYFDFDNLPSKGF
jgi:hypothetical protein